MKNILAPLLSIPGRNLQLLRYLFAISTIIAVIIVHVGPLAFPGLFYYYKLNTGHIDMSTGIYNAIRSSASPMLLTNYGGDSPIDLSLTNSEVDVFSSWSESQVKSAPQFIVNSLWKCCYGYYSTEAELKNNKVGAAIKNMDLKCHKNDVNAFDYKSQLEAVGLSIIVAYSGLEDEAQYEQKIAKRTKLYKMVPLLFLLGVGFQLISLVFSFALFGLKDAKEQLKGRGAIFVHILAAITVASFLVICLGVSLMMSLVLVTKKELSKSLNSFGVYEKVGGLWFAMAWVSFGASFMSMSLWVLPLWCANPTNDDADYNDNPMHSTKRRSISYSHEFNFSKQNKGNHKRPVYQELNSTQSLENPFAEIDSTIYENDPIQLTTVTDEAELRMLGESISKNPSVRRYKSINKAENNKGDLGRSLSKGSQLGILSSSNDPLHRYGQLGRTSTKKSLFYNDKQTLANELMMGSSVPIVNANHYQEETYDGYSDNPVDKSVANDDNYGAFINAHGRYENVTDPFVSDHNLLHAFSTRKPRERKSLGEESFLNDNEMEYLDFNNYVNKV